MRDGSARRPKSRPDSVRRGQPGARDLPGRGPSHRVRARRTPLDGGARRHQGPPVRRTPEDSGTDEHTKTPRTDDTRKLADRRAHEEADHHGRSSVTQSGWTWTRIILGASRCGAGRDPGDGAVRRQPSWPRASRPCRRRSTSLARIRMSPQTRARSTSPARRPRARSCGSSRCSPARQPAFPDSDRPDGPGTNHARPGRRGRLVAEPSPPLQPDEPIDSLAVAARAINNIIGGATLTRKNGTPGGPAGPGEQSAQLPAVHRFPGRGRPGGFPVCAPGR